MIREATKTRMASNQNGVSSHQTSHAYVNGVWQRDGDSKVLAVNGSKRSVDRTVGSITFLQNNTILKTFWESHGSNC